MYRLGLLCAVEVMTSQALTRELPWIAMVLVHAHLTYTRILHRHNTGIASQCKVREPIRGCDSDIDFRDVRAMCSQEVTSDFHGVLFSFIPRAL